MLTGTGASFGLLILRVFMGTAFVIHGFGKVQHPTTWLGNMADIPGWFQAAAAYAEFGGGIALALGFLTPLAAMAIAGTMIGALLIVHLPEGHPFISSEGGPSYELAAVYLATGLTLFLTGPGLYSVDAAMGALGRRIQRR